MRLKRDIPCRNTGGAEAALIRFGNKWNERYGAISELWMRNWENIIMIFSYPVEIRRVIYTTNAIESLNGVIRSRIKTKRILGIDESALKMVWIAVDNTPRNGLCLYLTEQRHSTISI